MLIINLICSRYHTSLYDIGINKYHTPIGLRKNSFYSNSKHTAIRKCQVNQKQSTTTGEQNGVCIEDNTIYTDATLEAWENTYMSIHCDE